MLTGGPCAGKTTMAQILTRAFAGSVMNVPEAASLLFSGGFPRFPPVEAQRAAQRAIFFVQHELEASYESQFPSLSLVLDRGTVDGAAYWPEGPVAYFAALGSSLDAELARYTDVIYLESAAEKDYWAHQKQNPNRTETWEQAKRLDEETKKLWSCHPRFVHVPNNRSFQFKVLSVLSAVSGALGMEENNGKE